MGRTAPHTWTSSRRQQCPATPAAPRLSAALPVCQRLDKNRRNGQVIRRYSLIGKNFSLWTVSPLIPRQAARRRCRRRCHSLSGSTAACRRLQDLASGGSPAPRRMSRRPPLGETRSVIRGPSSCHPKTSPSNFPLGSWYRQRPFDPRSLDRPCRLSIFRLLRRPGRATFSTPHPRCSGRTLRHLDLRRCDRFGT